MAGLETVPSTRLLTDLDKDVWFIICKYLDIKTRGRLACVCKALRDVFEDPIFWRKVHPVTIKKPNNEAGCCLVTRNIGFEYLLEIDMREGDRMAIELLGLLKNPMLSGRLKSLRLLFNYHDDCNMLDGFYTKAKSIAESESVAKDKYTFDNLRFLYVGIYRNTMYDMHDMRKRPCRELGANHICNAFKTLFPRMPQLTDLYIHHYYFTAILPDLEQLVHDKLPQLKNLEYKFSDDVCFPQDQTIHTSVTNPKLERLSGYRTNIQSLAKTYPSLKHWSFGRFTRNVVEDKHNQSEVRMPTVQSMAITCNKSCSQHSISLHDINPSKLLAAFPNLLAIKADLWTCVIPGKYNYHRSDVLQKACPKLEVLDISSHKEHVPADTLTKLLKGLKNLEVLVLPDRYGRYSNSTVNAMFFTEHLPKIRSLIRLFAEFNLSDIPTLKYRTPRRNDNVVVRSSDSGEWSSVRTGSNEWYEAHGINYFYPESTKMFKDGLKYLKYGEVIGHFVSLKSCWMD